MIKKFKYILLFLVFIASVVTVIKTVDKPMTNIFSTSMNVDMATFYSRSQAGSCFYDFNDGRVVVMNPQGQVTGLIGTDISGELSSVQGCVISNEGIIYVLKANYQQSGGYLASEEITAYSADDLHVIASVYNKPYEYRKQHNPDSIKKAKKHIEDIPNISNWRTPGVKLFYDDSRDMVYAMDFLSTPGKCIISEITVEGSNELKSYNIPGKLAEQLVTGCYDTANDCFYAITLSGHVFCFDNQGNIKRLNVSADASRFQSMAVDKNGTIYLNEVEHNKLYCCTPSWQSPASVNKLEFICDNVDAMEMIPYDGSMVVMRDFDQPYIIDMTNGNERQQITSLPYDSSLILFNVALILSVIFLAACLLFAVWRFILPAIHNNSSMTNLKYARLACLPMVIIGGLFYIYMWDAENDNAAIENLVKINNEMASIAMHDDIEKLVDNYQQGNLREHDYMELYKQLQEIENADYSSNSNYTPQMTTLIMGLDGNTVKYLMDVNKSNVLGHHLFVIPGADENSSNSTSNNSNNNENITGQNTNDGVTHDGENHIDWSNTLIGENGIGKTNEVNAKSEKKIEKYLHQYRKSVYSQTAFGNYICANHIIRDDNGKPIAIVSTFADNEIPVNISQQAWKFKSLVLFMVLAIFFLLFKELAYYFRNRQKFQEAKRQQQPNAELMVYRQYVFLQKLVLSTETSMCIIVLIDALQANGILDSAMYISAFMGISAIAQVCATPLYFYLSQRFNSRFIMMLAVIMMAASLTAEFAAVLNTSVWIFIFSSCFFSFSIEQTFKIIEGQPYAFHDESKMQGAFRENNLASISATVIGTMVAGHVAQQFGDAYIYVVCFIPLVLFALLVMRTMAKDVRYVESDHNINLADLKKYGRFLISPPMLLLFLAVFIPKNLLGSFASIVFPVFAYADGFSKMDISTVCVVINILVFVMEPILKKADTALDTIQSTIICMAGIGVIYLCFVINTTIVWCCAAFLFIQVLGKIFAPSFSILWPRICAKKGLSSVDANALVNTFCCMFDGVQASAAAALCGMGSIGYVLLGGYYFISATALKLAGKNYAIEKNMLK